mmetsp:Transcript_18303/g.52844  ORF Transcript_18303/g.52844 Transcript_18303/m.52844 type:complete len:333 (-) Transcript_18303:79-1077(-)
MRCISAAVFASAGTNLLSASAFSHAHSRSFVRRAFTELYAENGGAPQYEKYHATLRQAEVLGEDSVMLHIDSDETIAYEPGHVLALEIEGDVDVNDIKPDAKNAKDMKNNGGWMRGPYTISRASEKSFDVLVKVVGEKSKRFARATPGTPLKFGGKFKVPILEGINFESTKRVVLISTGVGVGPCIGAIEKALTSNDEDSNCPPIELHASYRNDCEVLYREHLDRLQEENPERFIWKANVSSESGRVSSSENNLQTIACPSFPCDNVSDTHYHLIGNGSMVNEFKAGLAKAGVPDENVTLEIYFNHKAVADESVVDKIAKVIVAHCRASVPL